MQHLEVSCVVRPL